MYNISIKHINLKGLLPFVHHYHGPFVIIGIFTLGFLSNGIIHFVKDSNQPSQTFSEFRRAGSYKFINPLLECDLADFSGSPGVAHLRNTLNDYINQSISNQNINFASVYYRDLNNGPWFGISADEYFSPSSLIKVPLLIAYLKIAESNPDILNQQYENTATFNPNTQNFKPKVSLLPNQKYTVQELLDRMIIYSDNMAYNLLNDNIDSATVMKIYQDLDVDISKAAKDPNGNIINVKSYASFFRVLYNSSYLSKDMSEKALKLLSLSDFDRGLVAGLPKDTIVAHKFGERQYLDTGKKQLHDCGIVYLPQHPYLLCVMTRGQDFTNLAESIKDISALVYSHLTQN